MGGDSRRGQIRTRIDRGADRSGGGRGGGVRCCGGVRGGGGVITETGGVTETGGIEFGATGGLAMEFGFRGGAGPAEGAGKHDVQKNQQQGNQEEDLLSRRVEAGASAQKEKGHDRDEDGYAAEKHRIERLVAADHQRYAVENQPKADRKPDIGQAGTDDEPDATEEATKGGGEGWPGRLFRFWPGQSPTIRTRNRVPGLYRGAGRRQRRIKRTR